MTPLTDAQRLLRRTRKSTPPSAIPGAGHLATEVDRSPLLSASVALSLRVHADTSTSQEQQKS